jgi:AcrR family transcriptional regulator
VRISKDPEERRAEIVNAAAELFTEKGFEQTAVSDIVKWVGVAQGTFYYYFKTKEDVFVAIVDQHNDQLYHELMQIAQRADLNAARRMVAMTIFEFQYSSKQDKLFDQLHSEANASLHQKVIINTIKKLTPVWQSVIEAGNKEGTFQTQYALEAAEFIQIGTKFLFDPGFFERSREDYARLGQAVQIFIERMLMAPSGSLAFSFDEDWFKAMFD